MTYQITFDITFFIKYFYDLLYFDMLLSHTMPFPLLAYTSTHSRATVCLACPEYVTFCFTPL